MGQLHFKLYSPTEGNTVSEAPSMSLRLLTEDAHHTVAAQVDPLGEQILKPGYHFIGSSG
jgi:hypothetical protein